MNTLLIESSTNIALVAVSANAKYAERLSLEKTSHSKKLFSLIDEALHECGIELGEIKLIGVGIGPGSFTGIRIAVSSARMLAQILDVPLIGIHSQMIYAQSLDLADNDCAMIAFDAKKDRVFGALYQKRMGQLEEIIPAGDYYPSEITDYYPDDCRVVAAGDGSERYADFFCSDKTKELVTNLIPDGKGSIELIRKIYESNPANRDLNLVVPLYARKSDAEVLLEKKKALEKL